MERVILHADLNNFFASVECLYRPELKDKPVAVGGDPELRHGIILAKNYPAKAFGIKTGEAIWQAKRKCPGLIVLKPNYKLYLRFARMARRIYSDYTDRIEPFGMDEAWLDVTGSLGLYGNGKKIADEIRARIKNEMGVTASVGVSWNKVFAKLGSDIKKPDATTVITKENFRDTVWPLPANELLYVGRATQRKLANRAIYTIGNLAAVEPALLRFWFGKMGDILYSYANGLDGSPVSVSGAESMIKSIGNSTTTPRDLKSDGDIKLILYVLCESVAMRLREHGLECGVVEIWVRDCDLFSFVRQKKQSRPTCLASEIHRAAMELFRSNYSWNRPVRSVGVRGCCLSAPGNSQLSLFEDEKKHMKLERLEAAEDSIRRRFGNLSIVRGILLSDRSLGAIDPKSNINVLPTAQYL